MTNFLNKKFLVVVTVIMVAVLGVIIYKYRQTENTTESFLGQDQQVRQISDGTLNQKTVTITLEKRLKIYRNEQYGFEFQYPEDLILKENTFKSYYSKFNLKIYTKIGEQFDPTFGVNIVLSEFAEQSFKGLEKTTEEVIVGGVSGVKYRYKFNERKETAVILPFNEYRLILAVYYEEYEDIFNQIISTFKFIK